MQLCLVSEMEPRSCALFLNPVGSVFISEPCGPGSCGCPPPMKIIPAQNFLRIRMNFPDGNHPCYEVTIVKKRLQEISISRQATFVFL